MTPDQLASPRWACPIEMAKALASPTGVALLLRWEALGADFQPHAAVFKANGRLVAEVGFAQPIGPEKQSGLTFSLSAPLRENA